MTNQIINVTVSEKLSDALNTFFDSERSLVQCGDDETLWEIHYKAWKALVNVCGSEDVAKFLCQHII